MYAYIIPIDSIGPGIKPCDRLTDCTYAPMQISTFGYLLSTFRIALFSKHMNVILLKFGFKLN